MLTLPWMSLQPAEPTEPTAPPATLLVMASRFRLRRWRDVPRFLVDSMRTLRQVRTTGAAVGVSLSTRPLRREFRTLSAWRDRGALDAWVGTQPHRDAMRRYRPAMAESAFTFWTVPSDQLPVSWHDAARRLDEAEREKSTRVRGRPRQASSA